MDQPECPHGVPADICPVCDAVEAATDPAVFTDDAIDEAVAFAVLETIAEVFDVWDLGGDSDA